ncbi:hypothetical protein ACKGJO_06725 [Gracilimonas sp. Q87]|uniref:hypothetical protein n=1 Tax=Gracilimonas sp. Q87 TaxID=3384766 RepID=UPI003983F843
MEHPTVHVCEDCRNAIVNDDYTGLDYYHDREEADERERQIRAGLKRLGWMTPTDNTIEFSLNQCECCKIDGDGKRYEMVLFRMELSSALA